MHVKVEQEGKLLRDFHTAGGGVFRGSRSYFAPRSSGGEGKSPVVTERWYLQDASFLVALEGEQEVLWRLAEALQDPVWPLSLGRKSCPPSSPVFVRLSDLDTRDALVIEPLPDGVKEESKFRVVWECEPGNTNGDVRRDVPVYWADSLNREYKVRFVYQKIEDTEVKE